MTTATREEYEALALERLAELARSENEKIALEAARTMLVHLRLSLPPRRQGAEEECSGLSVGCSGVPKTENPKLKTDLVSCSLGDLAVEKDVEKAREHVLRAMDRCAGLLEHDNPFVVLRAAREILQHYRHLCRERFKWVAWSEVRERGEKKRRGVVARAKVRDLGRELAGIRAATQNGPSGPDEGHGENEETCGPDEEYRVNRPPPIDWDKDLYASPDEAQADPPDPDERAPP